MVKDDSLCKIGIFEPARKTTTERNLLYQTNILVFSHKYMSEVAASRALTMELYAVNKHTDLSFLSLTKFQVSIISSQDTDRSYALF